MFMGFEGFQWFMGVVEDRNDPLQQGRLRVRVFGLHTDQKSKDDFHGIPTEELLWMHPMMPINSASMSGIGNSPTGAVEGTNVVGFFRDKFCQDGVIMGTVGGTYAEKPNSSKGFSDPNGVYPTYIGNDVNVLARGVEPSDTDVNVTVVTKPDGIVVKEPNVVAQQNDNISQAPAPNELPLDQIPVDDDPNFTIEKMLIGDEGKKLKVYWDHLGYPTIGIGHLIARDFYAKKNQNPSDPKINSQLSKQIGRTVTNGIITEKECSTLFAADLIKVQIGIRNNSTVNNVYQDLNASRRMAIENMCFQMGVGGVAKFKNTLASMKAKEWKTAYNGLMSSLWAKQTQGRASRISQIVLTGNLESYGVIAPKPPIPPIPPITFVDVEIAPDDPYVAPDTRTMFVEPPSSYAAQYPYNQVFQTEAGHIQEFDSTPNNERYHLKHPSGTFTEIQPDGKRIDKIFGDNYTITINDRNIEVGGDLNVVVLSNTKTYIMGHSEVFIDGNALVTCRGNMTTNVEGNMTSNVSGDIRVKTLSNAFLDVAGDVTETIKGNVAQDITGNVTQIIAGGVDSDIAGDYNIRANSFHVNTSADATIFAGGNTHLKGSNAVMEASNVAQISGTTITLN